MSAPVQKLSTPVDQVNHHFASPINRKHPNVSPLIPGAPVKFKNIGGGPTPVGAGGTASSSSSTNVGGLLSKTDTPEEQQHHDFSDERTPASIPTSVTKTDSTTSPSSSGEQHVSRSSVDGPDLLSGNSSSVLKDKEMSTSSPRLSPRGEEGEAAGETAAAAPRPAEENARAPSSDIQKPPPPSDGAAREKSDALRGVLRPPPPKTKKASPPAEPQRFTGISPWKYENASWIKEKLANKYFEAAAEAEALAYERQKLASASMDSPGLRSVASGGGYGSMSEDVVMGMGGMSLASGHGSPPVARPHREWNDHPLGVSGYGGNGKGSYGGSSSSTAMGGYGAHAVGAANHGGNLLYNQLRSAGGVGNGAAAGTTSSTYLQQLLANTSTAPQLAPSGDALLNGDDTSWLDEILNPSPVNDISDFLGLGIAAGTAVNGPTQQPPALTLPNPMQLLSPASAARMMPPPPPPIGMETTSAVPGGTPLMGATFPPPSFPLPPLVSESAISPIPSIPGLGNAATDSVASALGLLDVVGVGNTSTSVDVDLEAWVNDVVSNSPNVAPSMAPASDPSFENMLVEAVLGDFFEQGKANAANVGTGGVNVADLLNSNNNTTAAASDADNFNDLNTLVQNLPEHAKQDMRIRAKQSPFIRNKMVNAQPKVVLDKNTYESADSSIKTPVPVPTRTPGNGPLTSRAKPGRPTFLNLPGDTGEFDRTSSSDGVDSRIPAEARASSKRKAVSPTGVIEVPPLKKVHS